MRPSSLLLLFLFALGACDRDAPAPMVVLLAVDGATPETIAALRAEGRLPNIDRLARSGVLGPMESLAARRRLRNRTRRGYWSPIVWASMATGKVPDKHGIVDFLLPVPGTSFAWIGNPDGPPSASLKLPELRGTPPYSMRLRMRSYPRNGAQRVAVSMNGHPLGAHELPPQWSEITLDIPTESLRPAQNTVSIELERQSRPSDNGLSKDERMLAGALAWLEITDAGEQQVLRFDPIYERFSLGAGFHKPEAQVVEAQSAHLRAQPVWGLLGDAGHPVGVVGYWNTWPATPVNGFLVSSHVGVRGVRQGVEHELTWPPELANDIESLAPDDAAMKRMTGVLYPESCAPLDPKSLQSFEKILWQDAFYFRTARKLLPTLDRGFFTVYFESIDASGHLFLPLESQAMPLPEGCPESVRGVVAKTYEQVDAWVGELVAELPDHATVMLVSDHGMAPGGERGLHAPFGVFLARGPGVRQHRETRGTTVLDVAPTILYALGESVPLDMDGAVAVSIFEPEWLASRPPRYVDVDTSLAPNAQPAEEVSEELLERLRSLGYLQ